MRSVFDVSPLYRSTVGFDRVFDMFDRLAQAEQRSDWPPYNIERTGENAYRISVAVAGFSETDLSIEAKENRLTIRGERQPKRLDVQPSAGAGVRADHCDASDELHIHDVTFRRCLA